MKGLVAHEPPDTSGLNADSSEKAGNHGGNFCSECHIAGKKAPLDLTLKTRMRVASSCSVNWWVCQSTSKVSIPILVCSAASN